MCQNHPLPPPPTTTKHHQQQQQQQQRRPRKQMLDPGWRACLQRNALLPCPFAMARFSGPSSASHPPPPLRRCHYYHGPPRKVSSSVIVGLFVGRRPFFFVSEVRWLEASQDFVLYLRHYNSRNRTTVRIMAGLFANSSLLQYETDRRPCASAREVCVVGCPFFV